MKIILLGSLFCFIAHTALAGDAIAIGYNYEGVWTAVTYNRSSTPKGGAHYHNAIQACNFAVRDLYARAAESLVRTEIVGRSDRTGYVTVMRGKAVTKNKDVTAVGRGLSQTEADQKAFALLEANGGRTDEQIVYRYFSYGDDTAVPSRTKRASKRLASRNQNGAGFGPRDSRSANP
jgi:hypothetical protein